jgi:hypothetical protein
MLAQGYRKAMKYAFFKGLLYVPQIKPGYIKEFLKDVKALAPEVIK